MREKRDKKEDDQEMGDGKEDGCANAGHREDALSVSCPVSSELSWGVSYHIISYTRYDTNYNFFPPLALFSWPIFMH